MNYENNENIKKAIIKVTNKERLKVIKLINEPTAAAISYGDIIKSDNERKVLIFSDWWKKLRCFYY